MAKRLDIAVTAISAGMDVRGIFNLDLGYAPPYSNALDNIINLSSILENKIEGIGKGLSPLMVKDILSNGRDVLMIDVQTPAEFKEMRINDERVKWIPLGKLRSSLSDIPGDRKIITFCKPSLRGYEASKILSGAGLSDVAFMDGGIAMWPFEIDRSTVSGI
jgi:rhodanese-related sulfurtransferase